MHENEIAKIVFDTVVKIHKKLGPGLLESAYEKCLVYELRKQGLFIENQVVLPLRYDDLIIVEGYRLDLVVEKNGYSGVKSSIGSKPLVSRKSNLQRG